MSTGQEISFSQAMAAIEKHTQVRAAWMGKALSLLQIGAEFGRNDQIDWKKFAEKCRECAESMP